jgi:hypothetical protein
MRQAGQGVGGRGTGRGGGKAVYAAIMEHTVINVSMYVYLMMPVVARSEPLAEYQAQRVRRGFPLLQLPACLRAAPSGCQAQALSLLRC